MSRTRRILGGASIGYGHQIAVIALGLWLTPFLLRRVGAHEYGLWLLNAQLLGYLSLLDLGVLAILPRDVAAYSGLSDRAAAQAATAGLIARVRTIVRRQLPALAGASALVWWLLPVEWAELRSPFGLVLIAFVLLYPLRVAVGVLQGLQDSAFLAKTQLLGWTFGTMTTIALVVNGQGLYALAVGWIVTTAVPAFAAWRRAGRQWPRTAAAEEPGAIAHYFQQSLWISVGQIAQVLLAGSDVLLLGAMFGPSAVVGYACTGKLITVFANHPQLLMHVAQPALTELRASSERTRLATVATALTHVMLMMSGVLAVVIIPFNEYFVNWWVGENQYGGWWLTIALTAMMFLRHWNVATIYTLFCFGYEKQISLANLADGAVTVIATALLAWQWGPIGAPIGSMLGVLLVSLPLNARAVAREMGMSPAGLFAGVLPLLVRVVGVAALVAIGSRWVSPSSTFQVGGLVMLAVTTYAATIYPVAWRGPVGPYLRTVLQILRQSFVRHRRQALGVTPVAADTKVKVGA